MCSHTPAKWVVERKHRQILEVERSLRFQVFYGREPNIQYLRVLGSLCYATITKDTGDKFGPGAEKAVHLGYSSTRQGYLLYGIDKKQLFVNGDVVFKEAGEVASHDAGLKPPGSPHIVVPPPEPLEPRRTKRVHKPPNWLHNFVHTSLPSNTESRSNINSCYYCHAELGTPSDGPPGFLREGELSKELLSFGFVQSHHDYSLFTKNSSGHIVIILVYVDDLLIIGFKHLLQTHFKIKDLWN
ncbi:hypothetical protein KY290_010997 [Solanum tuberosum]|uniref:Retroviral polymerase SH3-like domain-containing protein n=1 Tax=Solanum tuberosum TaxID=4113 RepID=A0ABQ7VZE8_SOLTU|nr:hypothetical protein KY290_010997 [Solanum tuberosum]